MTPLPASPDPPGRERKRQQKKRQARKLRARGETLAPLSNGGTAPSQDACPGILSSPSKDENPASLRNEKAGAPSKDGEIRETSKDAHAGSKAKPRMPSKDEVESIVPSQDEPSKDEVPPSIDEASRDGDQRSAQQGRTAAGYVTHASCNPFDARPSTHPLECRSLHTSDDRAAQLNLDVILSSHGCAGCPVESISNTLYVRSNNNDPQD